MRIQQSVTRPYSVLHQEMKIPQLENMRFLIRIQEMVILLPVSKYSGTTRTGTAIQLMDQRPSLPTSQEIIIQLTDLKRFFPTMTETIIPPLDTGLFIPT